MKINKSFLAPFYPFAGFAVAWYCFMPNLTLLFGNGMYRSQLVIHANFLYKDARYLWRKTTQPKTEQYKLCRYKYSNELLDKGEKFQKIPFLERMKNEEYIAYTNLNRDVYFETNCGLKPKKGT